MRLFDRWCTAAVRIDQRDTSETDHKHHAQPYKPLASRHDLTENNRQESRVQQRHEKTCRGLFVEQSDLLGFDEYLPIGGLRWWVSPGGSVREEVRVAVLESRHNLLVHVGNRYAERRPPFYPSIHSGQALLSYTQEE